MPSTTRFADGPAAEELAALPVAARDMCVAFGRLAIETENQLANTLFVLLWCLREHGQLGSDVAGRLRGARSLLDVAHVLGLDDFYATAERGEPYQLLQRYNGHRLHPTTTPPPHHHHPTSIPTNLPPSSLHYLTALPPCPQV